MRRELSSLVRAALTLSGATLRLLEAVIRVAETDARKQTPAASGKSRSRAQVHSGGKKQP
jgi:hypothetical protein